MPDAQDGTGVQSTSTEANQYDAMLRAMEEGLPISLNNEAPYGKPTGELRVASSSNDKTEVHAFTGEGKEYLIHRNHDGDLVYSEVTDNGLRSESQVFKISVLDKKLPKEQAFIDEDTFISFFLSIATFVTMLYYAIHQEWVPSAFFGFIAVSTFTAGILMWTKTEEIRKENEDD